MPIKINTEIFISKSKQIHNNRYDYSLTIYKSCQSKIKIICPIHGIFEQRAHSHLQGKGCLKCRIKNHTLNINDFISKANTIHHNKYDYSLVQYKTMKNKIDIICSKHGIFSQRPMDHINSQQGCPKCNSSKGELAIEQFLKEHNIKYETQKRFTDCRNERPLPFDFYLPDHNLCVEFDGPQHNDENNKWYSPQIQINDKIKTQYCQLNDIHLIRIPFQRKEHNIITYLKPILTFA